MSRNTAKSHREKMPAPELRTPPKRAEDPKEIRRRQLAKVLSHQGKIDLDIDSERLAQLRSAQ
jgi:hypothetical protein